MASETLSAVNTVSLALRQVASYRDARDIMSALNTSERPDVVLLFPSASSRYAFSLLGEKLLRVAQKLQSLKAFYADCARVLGWDSSRFANPPDNDAFSQMLLATINSLAYFEIFNTTQAQKYRVIGIAGQSLGLDAASVASGVLSVEQMLRLRSIRDRHHKFALASRKTWPRAVFVSCAGASTLVDRIRNIAQSYELAVVYSSADTGGWVEGADVGRIRAFLRRRDVIGRTV